HDALPISDGRAAKNRPRRRRRAPELPRASGKPARGAAGSERRGRGRPGKGGRGGSGLRSVRSARTGAAGFSPSAAGRRNVGSGRLRPRNRFVRCTAHVRGTGRAGRGGKSGGLPRRIGNGAALSGTMGR